MLTDTEQRIKELLVELKNRGANMLELDGKPLNQALDEAKQEINKLRQENDELKQKVGKLEKEGVTQKFSSEEAPPASDTITREEHDLLKRQVEDLEEKMANLKVGGNDIDLTKEFSPELLSLSKTDLELDQIKPAIGPEILNKALKLDAKGKGVAEEFPFPGGRVLKPQYPPLTMRE